MPARIEPVFSPEKLRELYVIKQLSGQQIVLEAQRVMGWASAPDFHVAYKWLDDAGIARRNARDARNACLRKPEIAKKIRDNAIVQMRRIHDLGIGGNRKGVPSEAALRGAKKANINRKAKQVYYRMTCRVCNCEFARLASMVHRIGKKCKFICCHSLECRGRISAYIRNLPGGLREVIPGDYDEATGLPRQYERVTRNQLRAEEIKGGWYPKNPGGINTGNPLEETSFPIRADELKRLYDLPMSTTAIGRKVGRSAGTVCQALDLIGVVRRTQEEIYAPRRVWLTCSNALCANGANGTRAVFARRPSQVPLSGKSFCSCECRSIYSRKTHTLIPSPKHSPAKLSAEEVSEIRTLWKMGNVSKAELARRFSIGWTAIANILSGHTWKFSQAVGTSPASLSHSGITRS